MSERRLRVCIDARLLDGSGGVQTFITGLARGLARLGDDELELRFLVFEGEDGWLRPHLPPGARTAAIPFARAAPASPAERLARRLRGVPVIHDRVAPLWRRVRGFAEPEAQGPSVPPAPAAFEALDVDVVHFTHQSGFLTGVPSIYHPHDLQHLHHPELFDDEVLALREAHYGPLARQAAVVAAGSSWIKDDVVTRLGVPADKVHVIPLEPPEWQGVVPGPLPQGLPDRYALYPAVMWPHKNHVRLVEAVAILRAEGLEVPLVLTGGTGPFAGEVRSRVAALGLGDLVRVLEFVDEPQLRALYESAWAVVVPTLFEAASFPVWEAFRAGVPVAASTATSMPRQVGDAGVLFDPLDAADMACAIRRVWTDTELRATAPMRGRERLAALANPPMAERFAALYRVAAGRPLTPRQQEVHDTPVIL